MRLFYRATAWNATHGIAKAFLSVRPSFCTNACIMVVRKRKKLVPTFTYYMKERLAYPSFPRRRMVGGDDRLYLKFWAKLNPFEQKRQFSVVKFARSASAVTPSEKSSMITDRKATTCFSMSLRWTSYVPPKTQNGRFQSKIALHLKKFCCKVSFS